MLFEIPYRLGDGERWALVCVLLEHQTRTEWRVPLTTLIYAVLYWEWQLRLWEQHPIPRPTFQLTPILPIVLHTGSRPWGSARNLQDLVVEPAVFRPFVPSWQPMFWELAEHSPDFLLNASDAFFQALTVLRVEKQEQAEVERTFREALQRVDSLQNTDMVRWKDMIKFMFGWAHNRRPRDERQEWQTIWEQWQTHQSKPETNTMIVTIADEMRWEAKVEHAHDTLLRLGRSRFGEADATALQSIRAITDLDRLDRMLDAILQKNSWAELLIVS